jgi:hypothetical protein
MSVTTEGRYQCFKISDKYLTWVGISTSFHSEHIPLLSVCGGTTSGASFLGNLVYYKNYQSFVTASHEFNATPTAVRIRKGATDTANKTVDSASECASWFVVTFEYHLASAGGDTGVIPDLAFVAIEEVSDEWLISSKFGFRKSEDVSTDIFHLEKQVEHVCTVVLKANAIDILKIYTEELVFPH